ncbi:MAG TPA: VTT domain-containing protein [Cytophagaceae bacterium]|nr:VTT domain-containing protein [Cytophagaceae bacterium]
MDFVISIFKFFIELLAHPDKIVSAFVANYGNWVYAFLFLIIFVETGLVIMPFLPGDSLLFLVGAFASQEIFNLWFSIGLLFIAAVAGDTLNYLIGKKIGPVVFEKNYKLIKKEHLLKAQSFYEKHGAKAIILARFVPIVRTFAPFIAGVASMNYSKFISYNLIGGAIWVVGVTLLGFFLGEIPVIKNNFEKVVLLIVFVSILPIFIEFFKSKLSKKA